MRISLHGVVRDDLNRHKADAVVNSKPVKVLNREKRVFEDVPQSQIRVGDIVQVNEGEIFPADLVFLRSGDPKAPKSCWVNTKSLDGETDNKYRQALKVGAHEFVLGVVLFRIRRKSDKRHGGGAERHSGGGELRAAEQHDQRLQRLGTAAQHG